jgi:hypothetical protein
MKRNLCIVPKLLAAGLAVAFFPGAKSGCGSEESRETLESPVQAVATVLENSDGTVNAELVLISTATPSHQFVDTAENVEFRMPTGDLVPLPLASAGHYATDSATDPNLVYQGGERYRVSFDLDDEDAAGDYAGGNFVGSATAPDDEVTFNLARAPEFAGDSADLEWTPAARRALVTVLDANGDVVYKNFDFAEPQFEGDKWARFETGGSLTLSVDTFPEAGDYTITLCAIAGASDWDLDLSAELGVLSGFLLGRCAAPETITVPE